MKGSRRERKFRLKKLDRATTINARKWFRLSSNSSIQNDYVIFLYNLFEFVYYYYFLSFLRNLHILYVYTIHQKHLTEN